MGASVSLWSWGLFWVGGKDTDYDIEKWRLKTPTVDDDIIWYSGPNEVDSMTFPARDPDSLESKFNFPSSGVGPLGKVFHGMSFADIGPSGTLAVTKGKGYSYIPIGTSLLAPSFACVYVVDITVTPGGGRGISCNVEASADDPIVFKQNDLAGSSDGYVNFYLPIKISEMMYSEKGSGGMSVAYETADEKIELLKLSSSKNGINVDGGTIDFFKIFLISEPLDNPIAQGRPACSISALNDVVEASMKDGIQTNPISLGLFLENIPIPKTQIDLQGNLGKFHVISQVSEKIENQEMKQQIII